MATGVMLTWIMATGTRTTGAMAAGTMPTGAMATGTMPLRSCTFGTTSTGVTFHRDNIPFIFPGLLRSLKADDAGPSAFTALLCTIII